jgi:S1-C subfamily serine protease
MVKEYLSQRGVDFRERDVSRNPAYARELMNSTGQMGVPVTVIDRQVVVGYDQAKLEQVLSQNRTSEHPPFGASIADAGKIKAGKEIGVTSGAYVGRVKANSAAARLGLAPGDIIIELNDNNIAGAGDLERVLSGIRAGTRISIVYLRNKEKITARGTR